MTEPTYQRNRVPGFTTYFTLAPMQDLGVVSITDLLAGPVTLYESADPIMAIFQYDEDTVVNAASGTIEIQRDGVTIQGLNGGGVTGEIEVTPISTPTFTAYATIAVATVTVTPAWQALHVYAAGAYIHVTPGGFAQLMYSALGGTSGAGEPDWGSVPSTGDSIVDGSVTWTTMLLNGDANILTTTAPSVLTPTTTRQNSHGYVLGDVIYEASHAWVAYYTGTSAASAPNFAGAVGGVISDGSVLWGDGGGARAGSFHVYVLVTPVVTS